MAALNFPNDPSAQTPVNTFSPTSTPEASTNGVTYFWSGTYWTATGSSDSGQAVVPESLTPPAAAAEGNMWFNSDTGRLYIYYQDADGLQWIDASPDASPDNFLSAVEPDTAQGLITFAAGVSVTGGGVGGDASEVFQAVSSTSQVTPLEIKTNDSLGAFFSSPGAFSFGGSTYRQTSGNPAYRFKIETYGLNTSATNQSALFVKTNFTSEIPSEGTSYKHIEVGTTAGGLFKGEYIGLQIGPLDDGVTDSASTAAYGIYSEVGGSENYNFYASGNAPNYFAGTGIFSQTSDASTPIDNTGANGISLSPVGHGGRVVQQYASTNASGGAQYITRTGNAAGQIVRFYYAATSGTGSATNAGNITLTSATSVNFGTTSDYRLKTNVSAITGATDAVKALKPYAYEFTNGPGVVHQGFFAHELQEKVPMAVTGAKDAVDEDGKPEYQTVDLSKVVPLLTKALQEALARIEALENA